MDTRKIVWLRENGCPYGEKLTSGGQYKFSRAEPHGSGSVLIFEVGYRGHPNGVSVFLRNTAVSLKYRAIQTGP